MARIHRLHQADIRQNHLELIGLEMADEMPLKARESGSIQSIDLGEKLLRTALRKDTLPCLVGLHHCLKRMEFGHGDKLDIVRNLRKKIRNSFLNHCVHTCFDGTNLINLLTPKRH